jgi:hypothetical protein
MAWLLLMFAHCNRDISGVRVNPSAARTLLAPMELAAAG